MKLKNVIFSSMILSSVVFASDCVCFKLEGEFGKELKALIEKHQGSLGKVKVKDSTATSSSSGLLSIFTVEEKAIKTKEDVLSIGKKVYNAKCSFCHGQNGELAGNGMTKAPNSMSEEELVDSLIGYSRDDDFGGSMRMIMSQYVDTLSKDEMKAVAKYIKSLK
jgi:cytochrome c553